MRPRAPACLLARSLVVVAAAMLAACERPPAEQPATRTADGTVAAAADDLRLDAVLADPDDLPDDQGEWIRVRNAGREPIALRGWTIASGSDAPHVIARAVSVAPGATALRARAPLPGAAYVYGGGIALGNADDWVALRDRAGRTVDSLAWDRAPRGEAIRAQAPSRPAAVRAPSDTAIVVRVLDVGQGDAVLVENGGSRILIDGGPDPDALGRHLDALGLDGQTIDAVIVTHPHLDHYNGLRELFRSRRRITVRYFIEARDPSPNRTMAILRDSVAARAQRGALVLRDADDPCGDGRASCLLTMRGGAAVRVFRPRPASPDASGDPSPNDRSVPTLVLGRDTASFAMWLAGDAEHEAIAWMLRAGYPMRAPVMKANHHGSCNGVTDPYLRAVRPRDMVLSLEARNDFGFVHTQTLAMLERAGVRWWRTDQNGTVTLTSPGTDGSGYTVHVERGAANARGPSDRASSQSACRGVRVR